MTKRRALIGLVSIAFGAIYGMAIGALVPSMPTAVVGVLAGVAACLTVFVLTVDS